MKRSKPLKPGAGFAPRTAPLVARAGAPRPADKPFLPKARTCKGCRLQFTPARPLQLVCGGTCAARYAAVQRAREKHKADVADRKATRERLDAMRPLSFWVKKAQVTFNRYVRLRDQKAGHGCIDCGRPFEPNKLGGSVDAGHYLSRGSAPHLKFDERNVFAQRKDCNRPGGATRGDFRAGVIARIGLAAVEALEADQAPRQYRREDLQELITKYAALARELEGKKA